MHQKDLCKVLALIVKESGMCTIATIADDIEAAKINVARSALDLKSLGLAYTLDGYLHASQEAFEVAGGRPIAPDLFIPLVELKRRTKEANEDPRCACGNPLYQGDGDICLECITAQTELEMDEERNS